MYIQYIHDGTGIQFPFCHPSHQWPIHHQSAQSTAIPPRLVASMPSALHSLVSCRCHGPEIRTRAPSARHAWPLGAPCTPTNCMPHALTHPSSSLSPFLPLTSHSPSPTHSTHTTHIATTATHSHNHNPSPTPTLSHLHACPSSLDPTCQLGHLHPACQPLCTLHPWRPPHHPGAASPLLDRTTYLPVQTLYPRA